VIDPPGTEPKQLLIYSSRSRSTLEPDPASRSMKASLLGHYLSQAIDQLFRSPQKKIVMHAHRSWLYHSSRKRSCSRRCIAMLTTDLFKSLNSNSVRNDVLRRPSFNSTACFALVLLFVSSCGKKVLKRQQPCSDHRLKVKPTYVAHRGRKQIKRRIGTRKRTYTCS
jgi:hypothetical protein